MGVLVFALVKHAQVLPVIENLLSDPLNWINASTGLNLDPQKKFTLTLTLTLEVDQLIHH